MATASSRGSLQAAQHIAVTLAGEYPEIEAVCVFGSVARGDAMPDSDVDLLFVTKDDKPSLKQLRGALPVDFGNRRISLTSYQFEDLGALFRQGSSFASHLRSEARILFDREGRLRRLMQATIEPVVPPKEELALELSRLEAFEDVRQFGGNFLFCYSMLYAIGKSVVILVLARKGVPQYNRDRAFEAFRRLHPDLEEETRVIESLKPFYLVVTRRRELSFPFPYRGTGQRVAPAIAAIRALGAAR